MIRIFCVDGKTVERRCETAEAHAQQHGKAENRDPATVAAKGCRCDEPARKLRGVVESVATLRESSRLTGHLWLMIASREGPKMKGRCRERMSCGKRMILRRVAATEASETTIFPLTLK
jgi:hypothetical protein